MSKLERELSALRRLFEPWSSSPQGTVIWEPEASDPNGQFKRDVIAKAAEVIAAGDNLLAGASVKVPRFGEADISAIEGALATDAEQRDYMELATACERVSRLLTRNCA